MALSESTTKSAQAALVGRDDRRDLSLFRLGFDFLDRCLALDSAPSLVIFSSF